jgi:hypothetical protein
VVVVVAGGRVDVVGAGTAGFAAAFATCVPPEPPACFWPAAEEAPACDRSAALAAALAAFAGGALPADVDVVADVRPEGEDVALTG